ncbi:MAG: amino acid-binding protein [Gammaproteobacteria bacterium]|nr:amino acid-binding protein [Gammaproteobacteria bacterium]
MKKYSLLTIICSDRTGLISDITADLFDLGINLGDTNFAVLGEGAEFSAVLETPENLPAAEILQQIKNIECLQQAEIQLKPFAFGTLRGETGTVTHHVSFEGNDQPGLVARLTELLIDYGANIVRMDTRVLNKADKPLYIIELWVWIPSSRDDACLAALNNTAATLGMSCTAHRVV